tara:strand:- start:4270 stop:6282 length:2013 start_codon:yes stop_codon:yes gene_type:complete
MKDNILKIDLGTQTSPVVQETRGKDWIEFSGSDGWRNTYPQFIIDLYNNSSTNAAIINATSEMVSGLDLVIAEEDTRDLERLVKLKQFMANANSEETLHEVVKKLAFDFKLQGAFAINIIWSRDRTEISEIRHVGVEKIRCEKPDAMGRVNGYYISSDWSNTRTNKPYRVPAFNPKDRTSPSQILYSGLYSPGMDCYYLCDYQAANNWSLIDQQISVFHLANINNSFSGSYAFNFANGIPSQEERMTLERNLTDKFSSADNAGKMIITFSEDRNRTPEIVPLNTSDLHSQYLALQELIQQNVLTGHRCVSPALMGIRSSSGLGNNADEINAAANFYINSVCKPMQEALIKVLRKIFRVNEMDMPLDFVQLKPLTLEFTSEDLKGIMTEDELRKEAGLPPLNIEVREDFSKVGNIDGKPVFDTIEEAEAHAKKIGCEGYHEHEYEGKTAYMACKDHDSAVNLEKTELDKWLDETGEEIPEDWELINEEVVDGEHIDFDYEKIMNDYANEKTELATTPKNTPNKRSSQDGVNRSYNEYYKVRYVYATDNFLPNKSGTSREFCRKMLGANKIFRKEDLIKKKGNIGVNSNDVNPGFGHDGKPYSIFLYKGGPNCRHFFLRRIFKTSLRNAKSPISDDQIVSYTQARSEGFTAEKNNKLVAIAPQRMKNNGYYN